MQSHNHVFHTKHDFKPELGWAAFQLLAEIGSEKILPTNLHAIAKAIGSPLAKRSNLTKLFASMQDVGLIKKKKEGITLSKAGRFLAQGIGSYEMGFRSAVHCLYAWKWIWDGNTQLASPSWSYRQVLREILSSGSSGVDSDEIVLRTVSAAEGDFNAVKVSFSRSSVSGVTMWLESQAFPLIKKEGRRILRHNASTITADSTRLHLAALCALGSDKVTLNKKNIQLLAESVLIQPDELVSIVEDFAHDSDEFLFIPAVPSQVVFKRTEDPFIEWIVRPTNGKAL